MTSLLFSRWNDNIFSTTNDELVLEAEALWPQVDNKSEHEVNAFIRYCT